MQTSWVTVLRSPPNPRHAAFGREATPSALDTPAIASFLLPYVARAHRRGELPLQLAIERSKALLDAVPFAHRHERQEALRRCVSALLQAVPADSAAVRQPWLTEACHDLVGLVSREEGLAIARVVKHGATAFERAAELLGDCGLPVTASAVEKARSGWRRTRVQEVAVGEPA